MTLAIKVIYENGVFRPVEPIDLPEGQEALVTIDQWMQHREELKALLGDMEIRWSNPDDNPDPWVENLADEIDKAFQGEPPLSQVIIEDRGEV